jgi:peptide-methionine (S)-S-oxide reductase
MMMLPGVREIVERRERVMRRAMRFTISGMIRGALCAIGLLSITLGAPAAARSDEPTHQETAVFAGGCFWGMEAVFEHLIGVTSVVAGYAGGAKATARYDLVSTGTTGHAESVRVVFDPKRISYQTLLRVFFSVAHDPTELNRQGPDEGTQYRSVIFFSNDEQRDEALAAVKSLTAAHAFSAPIVTQIVPLREFYPAEPYHQHYAQLHPYEPYIVLNDAPKLVLLRTRFPTLVTPR